jgi:hypothetical protein
MRTSKEEHAIASGLGAPGLRVETSGSAGRLLLRLQGRLRCQCGRVWLL